MDEETARALTTLRVLGTDIATKQRFPTITQAESIQPENLTPEEICLATDAAPILDLRSGEEVWKFLCCVEGLTKTFDMTRAEVIVGLCAGELGATSGWVENGRLEIRHYVPVSIKRVRRESLTLE